MAPRKSTPNTKPSISEVQPVAAISGGELFIRGEHLSGPGMTENRPEVRIGDSAAQVLIGSSSLVIVRVPENAAAGEVVLRRGEASSEIYSCDIGIQIAEGLHPVTSPAVDSSGNIYTTFSGPRGQKVPVAVYRIDLNFRMTPFINDMMNATAIAVGRDGMIYISSRFEGAIYQANPNGNMSVFVEGMGVATGICFDDEDNLYVGDRSGTIFKISPSRQIYVFATLEPSISAYHLAWGPDRHLYVSGPTTSSFDTVSRIAPNGDVETFYRGLGRPQGMAFDSDGNLYIAASWSGHKGIMRITPERVVSHVVSGPGIVGLAFSPSRAMIVTTTNAVYRVDLGIRGLLWA